MRNTRFVYVIGDGSPFLKIGVADRVSSRLLSLQSGNPNDLSVLFEKRVLYRLAYSTEAGVHGRLREHHRRGEWFNVTVETAVATIEAVYERALEADIPPADPDGMMDLSRNGPFGVLPVAPEAIAWFRTIMNEPGQQPLAAKIAQAIERECGSAAKLAFTTEIISRSPLSRILARRPEDLRRAHAELAKAINLLCDIFSARREQALLDKIREIAA